MKRLLMLSVAAVLALSFATGSCGKATDWRGPDGLKTEAVRGFEEILDLWRAGNYGELYNRTADQR